MGQETCQERMDVSPAEWERMWPWDTLSDRGYGGQSLQGRGEITSITD